MPKSRPWLSVSTHRLVAIVTITLAMVGGVIHGDTVELNNGIIYRGLKVEPDKPLLWIWDGLRRVVVRDSKVKRVQSDTSFRSLEEFRIEQPLVLHAGSMPKELLSVNAGAWNDRGRREFSYEGSKIGKQYRMEQAINVMGPHLVRIRGVDGFWQGHLATSQIPREVVLGILAKAERNDKNERIRVARFLIQAEWYDRAKAELDQMLKDFPDDVDLRGKVEGVRASVLELEAMQIKGRIERCRKAQQPREAADLLHRFPLNDASSEVVTQIREMQRADEAQATADKALPEDLRALAGSLPKSTQDAWKKPLIEVFKALKDAPDAVRDRFVGWQKARLEESKTPEAQFALAMSGYVVGADAAVEDLEAARSLWEIRDELRRYMRSGEVGERETILAKLEDASVPAEDGNSLAVKKLDTATRIITLAAPPLTDDDPLPAVKTAKRHRVAQDDNDEPTEYAVVLPPEYHPLRSYPAVLALHDGNGPDSAIAWWSEEAAKRGYIVIAPEYRIDTKDKEYHFTANEHAAAVLSLRDARRRYAIDSDRVFVGGQLTGANMAWDFGLAHPDMVAGAAVISGMPFKYVNKYLSHTERVPLYVALGDLAPAANEVIFGQILKPLILKTWDVTYVEYYHRGLESLPEEATSVFDWMDKKKRDPSPKAFEVQAARPTDNRFYGVVVREFKTGRTMSPEAVEPLGKNLNPATIKMKSSSLSNLVILQTAGVDRMDVWISPKLVDFRKKMELRINNKSTKGMPKPELGSMLEDLRIRGDRQQVFWMKFSAG